MGYVNLEMLMHEIQELEGPIDKHILIRLIRNCITDPYKDLLIQIYKEAK